jgi:hypothetical protein
MANGALAYLNLFDSATPTASSAGTSTPITNLQNAHVANKWRGTGGTTDNFTATWTSDQTADTFAVMGLGSTFLATGTVRLQLFNSAAAQIYDSGTVAAVVDPNYGYAIHLLTPATYTTIRSAKWTFVQAGASYIEAGRVFAGVRTALTFNFQPGAQRTWITNTKKVKSRGGQTFVDRSTGRARTEEFTLSLIDQTQRWSLHEAMDIANADHTDVLFVKDTASTNLGRDTIWGLVEQVSPVTQPFTDATHYTRSYKIEERL